MQRLYTKIKLEIVDADIVIENADISVEIKKNSEGSPNYCTLNIYNISQNTYNIINDELTYRNNLLLPASETHTYPQNDTLYLLVSSAMHSLG